MCRHTPNQAELSGSRSYLGQQPHPRGEGPAAEPLQILCSEQDGLNRPPLVSFHSHPHWLWSLVRHGHSNQCCSVLQGWSQISHSWGQTQSHCLEGLDPCWSRCTCHGSCPLRTHKIREYWPVNQGRKVSQKQTSLSFYSCYSTI